MPAEEEKTQDSRTPGCPARGPHHAQREDPTTPSARTPPRPARGPHDTSQPSWIGPKSSPGILRGTLDTQTRTPAPRTLPTVNPSTARGRLAHSLWDMLDTRLWTLASP